MMIKRKVTCDDEKVDNDNVFKKRKMSAMAESSEPEKICDDESDNKNDMM